jgi:hypothetical protein
MAGQVSQQGAIALVNHIGGIAPPVISATAPAIWVPGLVWIDTATTPPTLMVWNSETWVAGPDELFIALLIGDPSVAGQNGGYAETVADIVAIEDPTAGYDRQQVTFGPMPADYSSATTYAVGTQVQFEGFVYTNLVAGSGTAPAGGEASNASWQFNQDADYPSVIANTNTLSFGPYTAAQAAPVQFAALVTCASGAVGRLAYTWTLPVQQQVNVSQFIQAGAGSLTLGQS